MQPVKIKIFDNEYRLKSEEDEEQVTRIAEYLNGKFEEIKKDSEGLSEKKMAILVALDIASDYFRLMKEREEIVGRIRHRSEALLHHIESVIN